MIGFHNNNNNNNNNNSQYLYRLTWFSYVITAINHGPVGIMDYLWFYITNLVFHRGPLGQHNLVHVRISSEKIDMKIILKGN